MSHNSFLFMEIPESSSSHTLCLKHLLSSARWLRLMLYTGGVEAHWREATVGGNGELVLEHLPFRPGESVDVLIIPKESASERVAPRSLRGSVLEYRDPFDPVGPDDWECSGDSVRHAYLALVALATRQIAARASGDAGARN